MLSAVVEAREAWWAPLRGIHQCTFDFHCLASEQSLISPHPWLFYEAKVLTLLSCITELRTGRLHVPGQLGLLFSSNEDSTIVSFTPHTTILTLPPNSTCLYASSDLHCLKSSRKTPVSSFAIHIISLDNSTILISSSGCLTFQI